MISAGHSSATASGDATARAHEHVGVGAGRASLSISVVVYHPDLDLLHETFESLGVALREARDRGTLSRALVEVVDNGGGDPDALRAALAAVGREAWIECRLHTDGGNVGYGRGHNTSMLASDAEFHLVLNPDVGLARDSLAEAIRFMRANDEVGLLTPRVSGPGGELQRLCRRYPSLLVLFLRGFAPARLRSSWRRPQDEYEMTDLIGEDEVRGVPLASGCFMFLRHDVVRAVQGFSPEYFLYFEDHDLSLKVARHADIAYVPAVRIVHHGGGASRKGLRHVLLYVASARRFFSRHGWRLW